jgi:hypothetical protein
LQSIYIFIDFFLQNILKKVFFFELLIDRTNVEQERARHVFNCATGSDRFVNIYKLSFCSSKIGEKIFRTICRHASLAVGFVHGAGGARGYGRHLADARHE